MKFCCWTTISRQRSKRKSNGWPIFEGWHVWAKNARTNHVHIVVTATGYAGGKVRDQFKANCTRVLRENGVQFVDRPVWTTGGDWQCVNDGEDSKR